MPCRMLAARTFPIALLTTTVLTTAVLVTAPHTRAQLPRMYLAAEFGIRDLAGTPFQVMGEKLMEELRQANDPKTKAWRECLLRQDKQCLPMRLSVYTASPKRGRDTAVAVVVDSAAALELAPLRRTLGASLQRLAGFDNAWRDEGVYLNQLELAKDRHRAVVVFKVDGDPTKSELFLGRALPRVREGRRRQLEKLRTAPVYALGDVIRVARALGSKGDRLLFAPERYRMAVGLEVGVAFRVDSKRAIVELSSTLPVGGGWFLDVPKEPPERCRLLGSVPPQPDVIVAGNQGPLDGVAVLALLEILGHDQERVQVAEKLFRCCDGRSSLYAQVDEQLARGAVVFALRDGCQEQAMDHARALARLVRKSASNRKEEKEQDAERAAEAEYATPRIKLRFDRSHLVVEARDGLLACGFGPTEEFAMAMARMVLSGKGPRAELPAKLRPETAPQVAWGRQAFVTGYLRRLVQRHEQFDRAGKIKPSRRFGFAVLARIGRLLLEQVEAEGMSCTMRWDNMRLQLRIRL